MSSVPYPGQQISFRYANRWLSGDQAGGPSTNPGALMAIRGAPPSTLASQISEWSNLSPRRKAICLPTRRFRSEEHTSELQSLTNLVCRLLLEKKKKKKKKTTL